MDMSSHFSRLKHNLEGEENMNQGYLWDLDLDLPNIIVFSLISWLITFFI